MTPSLPPDINDDWDWIDELGKDPPDVLRVRDEAIKIFGAPRLRKSGLVLDVRGELYWTKAAIKLCHEFWCQHVEALLKSGGQK